MMANARGEVVAGSRERLPGGHSHFSGESSMAGEPSLLHPTRERWKGQYPFLLEYLTFSIGNSVFSLSFHMNY